MGTGRAKWPKATLERKDWNNMLVSRMAESQKSTRRRRHDGAGEGSGLHSRHQRICGLLAPEQVGGDRVSDKDQHPFPLLSTQEVYL